MADPPPAPPRALNPNHVALNPLGPTGHRPSWPRPPRAPGHGPCLLPAFRLAPRRAPAPGAASRTPRRVPAAAAEAAAGGGLGVPLCGAVPLHGGSECCRGGGSAGRAGGAGARCLRRQPIQSLLAYKVKFGVASLYLKFVIRKPMGYVVSGRAKGTCGARPVVEGLFAGAPGQ